MTEAAKYFRPPWAVVAWADAEAVYVELPMEPVPYIQRFPLTEGGLSKALRTLRDLTPPPPVGSAKFTLPPRTSLPVPRGKRPKRPPLSPERRATILNLLKKSGL